MHIFEADGAEIQIAKSIIRAKRGFQDLLQSKSSLMQNPSVKKVQRKTNSTNYELRTNNSFFKIGQAAQILGVSIDTLRRWEKAGKISTVRTPGGTRLYHISTLKEFNPAAEIYPIETYQSDSLSTEELLKRVEKDTILGYKDTTETEESISNIPISQYPNIPSRKSSLITKFLIGSAFLSAITLLITSWITASYLTQPKAAQQFFKNNITSGLLSPFHTVAEELIAVINPKQAKELGFAPPEDPPPIATNYKLQTLDSSVLAVTASSQFLEVNSDTQINGSLFVRDSINGLSLEATAAGSFALSSGDTTLTVTNDALLDQDVSTSASPTFNTLNLSATQNQLVFQSGGPTGTLTWTPTAARVITLPDVTTTLVGIDNTQTLTNKSMSGASNTFTNIPNSALANNKVTVTAGTNLTGGGDINLGSSATISLKDSISLSGTITAGGVVKLADGTAAAPGLTFTNDTDSGMYRIGANSIGLITGGSATSGITINSSGNLGIGTISPGAALEVNGQVKITGGTPGSNKVLTSDGDGLATWTTVAGIGGITGSGTSGYIPVFDSASSIANSSTIWNSGGNVGIGTTSPLAALHNAGGTLFGTLSVADLATGGNIGTAATTIDIYTSFNLAQTTASQTITLADPTNTTAGRIVYLSNTGSTPFTFYGSTVKVGDTTAAMWDGNSWNLAGGGGLNQGTVNNSTLRWNASSSQWVENTGFLVDSSGNLSAGTGIFSGVVGIGSSLNVSGNVGIGVSSAGAALQVNGGGLFGWGTAPVAAPANGLAVSGSMGIGTTSPAAALEVIGATILRGNLTFNADNSFDIGANNATRPRTGYFGTSVQSGVAMDADVSGFFGTPMGYFAGNSESNIPVVIVGTGANTYGAEINGLKTRATSTNANTIVQNNDELMALQAFGADGASYRQAAGVYFYVDGTPGSSDMPGRIDFKTSLDGTILPLTRMTIKNDGNVGIGFSSPAATLDVIGTSLLRGTNGTYGLAVTAGGNVGIGTTSPSYQLETTGSVGIGGSLTVSSGLSLPNSSITNANLVNSAITVSATAGTGISVSGSPVSLGGTLTVSGIDASTSVKGVASFSSTNFSVSSGAVNTIQDIATTSSPTFVGLSLTSGNLGIGTSATGAKLQVNGGGIFWPSTTSLTGPTNGLAVFGNVGIGITTANSNLSVSGNAHIGSLYQGISAPTNGLFVDGNVGIGATTSTNKLDVWGNARIAGTLSVDSTSTFGGNLTLSSGQFLAPNGTSALPSFSFSGDTDTGLWNLGTNFLALTTNGAGALQAGQTINGLSINANGNVGIGTSSPTATLDVAGATSTISNTTGDLTITPASNLIISSGNVGIGFTSPTSLFQINSGSTAFTVSSTGNVGIGGSLTVSSGLSLPNSSILNANLVNSSITVSATAGTGISVSGSPVSLGGTLTVSGIDASTSVKGVASFNSTNFSVSSGAVNTIQDIATTSSPTFVGLSLTSGNLGIGTSATGAKLQVNDGGIFWPTTTSLTGPTNGLAVFGNVGIGTTTTAYKLDVIGQVNASTGLCIAGDCKSSWTGVGGYTGSNGITLSSQDFQLGGSLTRATGIDINSQNFGFLGNVGIGTSANGGARLSVMGGNVGIGTTSPSQLFQVNYNSANPVVITSGGNVGIGTTSPGSSVHVYKASGTSRLTFENDGNSSNDTASFQLDRGGSSGWASMDLLTAGTSYWGIGLKSGDANHGVSFWDSQQNDATRMYISTGGNVGIGVTTVNSMLSVAGGAHIGSVRQGISAPTDGLFVDGNVGIGATTSSNKLDVWGDARIAGTLTVDSTSTFGGNFTLSSGQFLAPDGSSSLPSYSFTNSTSTGMYSPSANALSLVTNGASTPALTITAGGNVGIGITSPTGLFQVATPTYQAIFVNTNGNVGIGTTNPLDKFVIKPVSNGGGLTIREADNGFDAIILQGYNQVGAMIINTGGTNEIVLNAVGVNYIKAGNLGIGTTVPNAKLSIQGNVGIGYTASTQVIPANGLAVFGNVGIGTTTANSNLSVSGNAHIGSLYQSIAAPTDGLFVDGNVGIGATTSSNKLDVWGNAAVVGSLTLTGNLLPASDDTFDLGSNTARWKDLYLAPNTLHIGTSTSDEYTMAYDTTDNRLGFNVNGSGPAEITFDSSGNVGIGTTGPTNKLQVELGNSQSGLLVQGSNRVTTQFLSSGEYAILRLGSGHSNTYFPSFYLRRGETDYGMIELERASSSDALGAYAESEMLVGTIGGANNPPLSLITNSVRRLIITSSGNIGIGWTSPAQALDLVGTMLFRPTAASGQKGCIRFDTTNSDLEYSNDCTTFQSFGSSAGGWSDQGTYTRLITTSANVGIGIATTPASRVHLLGQGTGTGLSFLTQNSTQTNFGLAVLDNGNVGIGTTAPSQLFQAGTGANTLAFSSGGNLGIGITTPLVTLDIYKASDPRIRIRDDSSLLGFIGNAGTFLSNAPANSLGLSSAAGVTLSGNNSTPHLFVATGGNIGIGTSSPTAALDVAGATSTISNTTGNLTITPASNLIINSGNLGVGASSPAYKLDVWGTFNATNGVYSNGVLLSPGTGSNWSVNGGNIHRSSGNVGIGISNPTSKLHVWDSGATTNALTIGQKMFYQTSGTPAIGLGSAIAFYTPNTAGAGTPQTRVEIGGVAENVGAGTEATGFVITTPSAAGSGTNTERFRISQAGNVGIGWTSPLGSLHIKRSDGNARLIMDSLGDGTSNSNNALGFYSNGTGKAYMGIAGTANQFITGSAASDLIVRAENQKILFSTDAGTTANMTINGGNVGIGDATPSYTLEVAGTLNVTGAVTCGSGCATGPWTSSSPNVYFTGGNVGIGTSTFSSFTSGLQVQPAARSKYGLLMRDLDGSDAAALYLNGNGSGSLYLMDGSGTTNILLAPTADSYITGGNVGIGTTGPGALLDINGNTRISSGGTFTLMNGAGNGATALYNSGGSGVTNLVVRMLSTDLVTFQSDGNVGLGAAPARKFQVYGGDMLVNNVTTGSASSDGLLIQQSGLNTYIGNQETADLQLFTDNGGNRSYIQLKTGGNVGIGATSPAYKLDVWGNLNATGGVYSNGVLLSPGTGSNWSVSGGNIYRSSGNVGVGGGATSPAALLDVTNSDPGGGNRIGNYLRATEAGHGLYLGGTTKGQTSGWVGQGTYNYETSQVTGLYNQPSGIMFGDVDSTTGSIRFFSDTGKTGGVAYAPTERMRINSSGNVGIGWSSPLASLHVKGNTALKLSSAGYGNAWDLSVSNDGDHDLYLKDTSGASFMTFDDSTGGISLGSFAGTASPADGMVISGNVGIGISSPTQNLNLAGTFGLRQAQSDSTQGCIKYNSSTLQLQWSNDCIAFQSFSAPAAGGWTYDSINNYVRLTTTSSNVGIGTASPVGKLHLLGSGTTTAPTFMTQNSTQTKFGLTILDNGNVGIGITNPATPLFVDTASTTHELPVATFKGSGSAQLLISEMNTSNGGMLIQSQTPGNNGWQNPDLRFLSLNPAGGNVGIGTTSPVTFFDVAGVPADGSAHITARSTSATSASYGGIIARNKLGRVGFFTVGDASYSPATYQAKADWLTIAGSAEVGIRFGANIRLDDMVISTTGNVGIGISTPTTQLHTTSGVTFAGLPAATGNSNYVCSNNGALQVTSAACPSASLRSLKTNITDSQLGLDTVMQLQPVEFNWNENYTLGNKDDRQIGFIAEDVEQVSPLLAVYSDDGNHTLRSVNYEKMSVLLVKAIQEQQDQINSLLAEQDPNSSLLGGLTVSSDGTLNAPQIKTDKLVLSADINFAASALYSLLSATNSELPTNNSSVDVLTSLNAVSNAILGIQSQESTTSAKLASLESRVESQESKVQSLEERLASISAQIANQSESTSSASIASDSAALTDTLTNGPTDTLGLTPPDILLATQSAQLVDLTVTSDATVSGQLTAYDLNIQNSLKSLGTTTLGSTLVAGDFTVDGTMSLTGDSINSLSTLHIQNSALAGDVDFFNGAVTIDKTGTLAVNKITLPPEVLGEATIPAGSLEIPVFSNAVTQKSKVFLTPITPTGGQSLILSEIISGSGFVVSLEKSFSSDIKFNWVILDNR